MNRDGQRWISSAVVDGQHVIRMMIISYLSEQRHLEGLQTAFAGSSFSTRCEDHGRLNKHTFLPNARD